MQLINFLKDATIPIIISLLASTIITIHYLGCSFKFIIITRY